MNAPTKSNSNKCGVLAMIVGAIYWAAFLIVAIVCAMDWHRVNHSTVLVVLPLLLAVMSVITWLSWRDAKAITMSRQSLGRVSAKLY